MKYHGKKYKFLRPSVYAISKETLWITIFSSIRIIKKPKKTNTKT